MFLLTDMSQLSDAELDKKFARVFAPDWTPPSRPQTIDPGNPRRVYLYRPGDGRLSVYEEYDRLYLGEWRQSRTQVETSEKDVQR